MSDLLMSVWHWFSHVIRQGIILSALSVFLSLMSGLAFDSISYVLLFPISLIATLGLDRSVAVSHCRLPAWHNSTDEEQYHPLSYNIASHLIRITIDDRI